MKYTWALYGADVAGEAEAVTPGDYVDAASFAVAHKFDDGEFYIIEPDPTSRSVQYGEFKVSFFIDGSYTVMPRIH